jgi:hypothetical protein
MTHQATLTFDQPLVRRAVFAFWRRTVGIGFLLATVALTVAFALLLASGDTSWSVGVLGMSLVVGVSFVGFIYFVHYRNAMAKFRAMGLPQASLSVEDATFTISSGLGSTTLPWSSVIEVWRFPGFWLVLFSKAHFITIPLATVSPDMQEFLLKSVQASGGKVVD